MEKNRSQDKYRLCAERAIYLLATSYPTLGSLGKLDEALQAFEKAIELNPKLAMAWYNKGNTLKLLGRITEADADFAKAKELWYPS
jgi:tetratricopeptide (TPR) repeat protein